MFSVLYNQRAWFWFMDLHAHCACFVRAPTDLSDTPVCSVNVTLVQHAYLDFMIYLSFVILQWSQKRSGLVPLHREIRGQSQHLSIMCACCRRELNLLTAPSCYPFQIILSLYQRWALIHIAVFWNCFGSVFTICKTLHTKFCTENFGVILIWKTSFISN